MSFWTRHCQLCIAYRGFILFGLWSVADFVVGLLLGLYL